MDHMPLKGPLDDILLEMIPNAGIVVCDGQIIETGSFDQLCSTFEDLADIEHVDTDMVVMPGMIDPHTHICWSGRRANDYAKRLAGKSYLEIAQGGGGIMSTVLKTREATAQQLEVLLTERAMSHLQKGVTTIEVKSGYCLNTLGELKLLEVINSVNRQIPVDLIPTCLAAHIKPAEFQFNNSDYLANIVDELLPELLRRKLTTRVDIFIDKGAFSKEEAMIYLTRAKKLGFDLVIHGEQFTSGGVALACSLGAASVDHLETIKDQEIKLLAYSNVIAVALPGASLGLGCQFAPARKLLDAGCSLAIGSDWNPGSAPMGDLLLQSSILGIFEKMTMAESLAAITVRAAAALGLRDRGRITKGYLADFIGFPVSDYREILYNQGSLKPSGVWKSGNLENGGRRVKNEK
jgi:imidazolonepropionase